MSSARPLDAQNKAFVDLLARAVVGVLLVGNAVVGYADSDIWGHMAIGVDTLRLGHLLRVDPYSFTHDLGWVNHEWLWEVTTAWLFQRGGLPALLVTRAVLVATVLWLVDCATRSAPGPIRLVTLCLVALACVGQWRSTRPQLSSLADETPEGRSIVVLSKQRYGLRERDLAALAGPSGPATFVPFSAHTRMSGVDLPVSGANPEGRQIRKGSAEAVEATARTAAPVIRDRVFMLSLSSAAAFAGACLASASGSGRKPGPGRCLLECTAWGRNGKAEGFGTCALGAGS